MTKDISGDFLIASIIKTCNDKEIDIWFNKLEQSLDGIMARGTVSRNIDKLFDFGIINGEWVKNGNSWVRVFRITGEARLLIENFVEDRAKQDESFKKACNRLDDLTPQS